uniref:Uncharacterized protein n=1 Tax=Anguilla anguilla TaxID=7936 RepID=A0A0E9S326_ANGAN
MDDYIFSISLSKPKTTRSEMQVMTSTFTSALVTRVGVSPDGLTKQ